MSLSIQPCAHLDLEYLLKLSKSTFIDAFEAQNNPADFKNYIDSAFSKEKLSSEMENPSTQFYFVFDENEKIGYLKLNKGEAQTDVNDHESLELERIYVVQQHQGKGIGEWLLQQVKQIAHDQAFKYIWLGVWEKNKAAIRFYEKHGFNKFGTHPYYIGTDKQTDWLMRLYV